MSSTLGFVFPGQGSQSVAMLAPLDRAHPLVSATFREASDALGFDLWELVREGPKKRLDRTQNTQPAMLAAGVAVWRVWKRLSGPGPLLMAGHSLGEYTALVCAGALEFADAIKLVAERGRLMQEAVPAGGGAMAAVIGLEDAVVKSLCAQAAAGGGVVEAVNFNAPGQVVIAGDTAAVQRASELAAELGARRVLPLPVSAPSHCSLMRPAAERLAERLADTPVRTPTVAVIHNVTVETAVDPDSIRDLLRRQLFRPVRWVETVRTMRVRGVRTLLELGPGKVLTGLDKRIDRSLTSLAVYDEATLAAALEELNHAQ